MLPKLSIICPPEASNQDLVIRDHEAKRQVWHQVCILNHELDYYCLYDLDPGWVVWEHEGKYISVNTVQYLVGLMNPAQF
jgi:hypothetical protein